MQKEEILHLGTLSRIALSESEVEKLAVEIESILDYVGTVSEIVADTVDQKVVGARFNVFREDEVTCEPGEYTETLLNEAPERDGRFLKVKKILKPNT